MIASRSNLERYGYGNYEIETWQPLGFSTDRIRTTKVHIQDQVFAVHVADITTHTNIEKQAEIESEEFLTPSDDEIHHDLVLEADVKAFTVDNCSNGELSSTSPTMVVAEAGNNILPAAILPGSTRLRKLFANNSKIIVCPGVYDGAGTTASRLGAADLGLAQLHDMRTNAEMIANLAPIGAPVIADMDTGYGGPLMVAKSLQQYHLAGVAGFHIEDQVAQKRCGHLAGKEVVNIEEYASRIKACVYKRKQLRSDIVIIARTDVLQSRGYVAAMERVHRARDLGADMGILEGVQSKEQAAQAVRELAPWLMCYNSVENGVSPLISAAEAEQMGYRIIIFSFACLAPAYEAIKSTLERLKGIGLTGSSVSPMTIFEVCGL
ncbi:hypothetical protein GMDG_06758 [Pseudogymnoascus destructans 20631-21]|uniref:Uncharacterized protein n=1 Tax=Pseudogymnoascus destructans (strain ATCC MYA-4855 / 20631-21) TaxID=658429 RepID=L8FU00_PSED2|nr:hypothetical protein GMDG_06758 [Pseudogymnoascus destructans 20631-21]